MSDTELQAIVAEFREAAKEDHPEGRRCVSATIAAQVANALLAEVERLRKLVNQLESEVMFEMKPDWVKEDERRERPTS